MYHYVVTMGGWVRKKREKMTAPNWYGADRWAQQRGWVLDPPTRALLAARLTRRRNYALAGAAPGLLLALSGVQVDESGLTAIYLAALGALVGLVVAAVRTETPEAPRRAAWIAPRRGRDYAPRFAVMGVRALAVVCVIELLVVVAIRWPHPRWAGPATLTAVLVAVVGGLHLALHMVAHKPLPAATAAAVAVNDGLRREASHAVAGGAFAFLVLTAFGGMQALLKVVLESSGLEQRWTFATAILLGYVQLAMTPIAIAAAAVAWTKTTRAGVDALRARAVQR